MEFHSKIKTIEWIDDFSRLIDQTILPYEFKHVDVKTGDEMYDAIKTIKRYWNSKAIFRKYKRRYKRLILMIFYKNN